jgi:hypothetical protein
MDSILSTLKSIKECIVLIKEEIDIFENMKEIKINLSEYLKSIIKIDESITNIKELFYPKVPSQHSLRMELIHHIEININNINKMLIDCKEWYNLVNNWKCCSISCWKMMTLDKPSVIEERMKHSFEGVGLLLEKLINLEKDIMGSAINIVNPIMRKVWVRSLGTDEINNSHINGNILAETLYAMLKEEEHIIKYKFEKEYINKQLIIKFIKYLDSLSGFEPNNNISINEINQYKTTNSNCNSVRALLNIDFINRKPK